MFNKFRSIKNETVIKSIMSFKQDFLSGLDRITVQMLKSNINSVIRLLSYIFNLAISKSTFPDSFKISIITHTYKKGDKLNI